MNPLKQLKLFKQINLLLLIAFYSISLEVSGALISTQTRFHSGDGTMGVFNIKRRRFELLSEFQSGDLTSVALMKRGKKVACGSSEGTVYIFNWNGFGATSDRFAVKAESVDCIVPITDSIMCTASMDGYIR